MNVVEYMNKETRHTSSVFYFLSILSTCLTLFSLKKASYSN